MSGGEDALHDCLLQFAEGDYLLLVDRAVSMLGDPRRLARIRSGAGADWGALRADVWARGLQECSETAGVELLSDIAWVGKLAMYDQVLSWK